jgi:regulator of CtrA degradation
MRRNEPKKEPISFGHVYARSETFRALFRDGMTLVEETAAYLDGDGRIAAKDLGRPGSIVYATESMRLTTRLMQLASWLLLHRSVNEGDMTIDQAAQEKRKIKLDQLATNMNGPGWDQLPDAFKALVARSLNLQKRVERIDAALFEQAEEIQGETNPVGEQIEALSAALKRRA